MFVGFVVLGEDIRVPFLFTDEDLVPTNTTSSPTYRIYDPDSLVSGSPTGTLGFTDTGSITNVVNNGSGLCRVTSASHKLQTNDRVTITGVNGATGVNGTHLVTTIDANTFDLQGSTFGGTYTDGGTWNVSGVYHKDVTASAGNGYESGTTYRVIAMGQIGGTTHAFERTFTVV